MGLYLDREHGFDFCNFCNADDGGEANSPPIGPDDKEIANLLNQYPFANLLLLLVSLHIHVDNITLDCSLT